MIVFDETRTRLVRPQVVLILALITVNLKIRHFLHFFGLLQHFKMIIN